MPAIYAMHDVSHCHTCRSESLIICRICTHGFCREHFRMCHQCHEWMCLECFVKAAHKCGALKVGVIEITRKGVRDSEDRR